VKICVWEDSGKIAEAPFPRKSIRGIIALPPNPPHLGRITPPNKGELLWLSQNPVAALRLVLNAGTLLSDATAMGA
jgi:hypothetical protein